MNYSLLRPLAIKVRTQQIKELLSQQNNLVVVSFFVPEGQCNEPVEFLLSDVIDVLFPLSLPELLSICERCVAMEFIHKGRSDVIKCDGFVAVMAVSL